MSGAGVKEAKNTCPCLLACIKAAAFTNANLGTGFTGAGDSGFLGFFSVAGELDFAGISLRS